MQVRDVRLAAGEEVVDAEDVVAFRDQPLAEVRAEKAGAAGDQNAFFESIHSAIAPL